MQLFVILTQVVDLAHEYNNAPPRPVCALCDDDIVFSILLSCHLQFQQGRPRKYGTDTYRYFYTPGGSCYLSIGILRPHPFSHLIFGGCLTCQP